MLLYKPLILVFSTAIFITIAWANQIDQNDIELVLKNGAIKSLRKYAELPDSDLFLTNDALNLEPSKFVNYSEYLLSLFNGWDEAELNRQHAELTLVFGSLDEKVGANRNAQSRPNLRRFLKITDDYPDETTASFRVPKFLREIIDMPTVLNCDYMLNKLHDARFDFQLNLESYTSVRDNELDRLSCALKGNGKVFMIDDENLEKLQKHKKNQDSQKLSEIKYHAFPIEAGQCVFLPSKWNTFIKTDYLWSLAIQWKHLKDPVTYKQCYPNLPSREEQADGVKVESDDDQEESKPVASHRKLSQFKYATDAEEIKSVEETRHLQHFLKYVEQTQSYTQAEFTIKIKKDTTIVRNAQSCDNECNRLIKKITIDLDIDKDESFQIEDFESLDEEAAHSANKKLADSIDYLRGGKPKSASNNAKSEESKKSSSGSAGDAPKPNIFNLDLGAVKIPIDLGPLESIGKTIRHVKDAVEANNLMGPLKMMIGAKFADLKKNLPADKKAKLEAIDFRELGEIFVTMFGLEKHLAAAYETLKSQQSKEGGGGKQQESKNENDQKKPSANDDDDDDEDDDEEEIAAEEAKKPNAKEDL